MIIVSSLVSVLTRIDQWSFKADKWCCLSYHNNDQQSVISPKFCVNIEPMWFTPIQHDCNSFNQFNVWVFALFITTFLPPWTQECTHFLQHNSTLDLQLHMISWCCMWLNFLIHISKHPLPWASVHWLVQCTLECHWLTQCTLGYHWATQRILAGCTGTPLEKLSWNSPTLECHWRNLVETAPHWDATGQTFAAYTGTPLEGLWQPRHAPTHIVKHAE